jgi:hypothetical protein
MVAPQRQRCDQAATRCPVGAALQSGKPSASFFARCFLLNVAKLQMRQAPNATKLSFLILRRRDRTHAVNAAA